MKIPPVASSAFASFGHAREGMLGAERRLERAADRIAREGAGVESSVDLIVSERAYQANAAVARTFDEMVGSLLDVKR